MTRHEYWTEVLTETLKTAGAENLFNKEQLDAIVNDLILAATHEDIFTPELVQDETAMEANHRRELAAISRWASLREAQLKTEMRGLLARVRELSAKPVPDPAVLTM